MIYPPALIFGAGGHATSMTVVDDVDVTLYSDAGLTTVAVFTVAGVPAVGGVVRVQASQTPEIESDGDLYAEGVDGPVRIYPLSEGSGGGGEHPNLAAHDALGLATQAELAAESVARSAADSAHTAAADPHAQYLTAAEGAAAFDALGAGTAAVAAHTGLADPHAQYETSAEAAAKVTAHEAAADPHAGYQRESEKGVAGGYASLDGAGTVPDAQIPAAIARDGEVSAAVAAHEADTTAVHGIADTAALLRAVQDEGTPLTATTLNFTGAGVTASAAGGVATVSIPGGSGGAVSEGRAKAGAVVAWAVPGVDLVSAATLASVANRIYYEPFIVTTAITVDALGLEVTTAGAGGTTIRAGIYNADVDQQPTSLVVEAPTPADASTTGVKTLTLTSPVALPAGRYLMAYNTDGTPTLRIMRGGGRLLGLVTGLGTSPFYSQIYVSQAHAALASTGVQWTTVVTATAPAVHAVLVRVTVP